MMLGARTGAWTKSGGGTPTARDYVQDGLVAMFHLKENAGWGIYDENATRWTNLVTGQLASNSGFVFTPSGAYVHTQTALPVPAFSLFEHSVEARISRFPNTEQNHGVQLVQYMSINGGQLAATGFTTQRQPIRTRQYIYEIRGGLLAPTDILPEDKHTLAATFEYDGALTSRVRFYIDGALLKESTSQGSLTHLEKDSIYTYLNANNYLDRLNVYSRAITAEEIARNYAIDKAMFNLP